VAPLKQKGDLAELMVAADLRRRGFKLAFPYGEDWDYDLIIEREGRLERVQVKYTTSDGATVVVRPRSFSLTNGKVRSVKHYTVDNIDWLAVYDVTSDRCYYIPAVEFKDGMWCMHLRLTPPARRRKDVRFAKDYVRL
jgi:PD-(D/E)XK endonuclease